MQCIVSSKGNGVTTATLTSVKKKSTLTSVATHLTHFTHITLKTSGDAD